MKISILAGVAALSAAVSAAPAAAPAPVPEAASAGALPACGYLVRPCQCPSGTQFATSTTYALIGGDAKNVQAISGDYYKTEWEFIPLLNTIGPDNTVGAVRNISLQTAVGTYPIQELLTYRDYKPDGSYSIKFEQKNVPVVFYPQYGPGSISGYWVTVNSVAAGKQETLFSWTINACVTGTPLSFKDFKEGALNNVIKILKSNGQLPGYTINPFSV